MLQTKIEKTWQDVVYNTVAVMCTYAGDYEDYKTFPAPHIQAQTIIEAICTGRFERACKAAWKKHKPEGATLRNYEKDALDYTEIIGELGYGITTATATTYAEIYMAWLWPICAYYRKYGHLAPLTVRYMDE